MARLSQFQRAMAIGMLQARSTPTAVARHVGCHVSTISRLVSTRQQTSCIQDRPRSGRPRVTTSAQDRYIRLTHLRNRQTPATETVAAVRGPRRPPSLASRRPEQQTPLRWPCFDSPPQATTCSAGTTASALVP
ncbi:Uncharacterised protein r2_g1410 [Pycnogonum litorale]